MKKFISYVYGYSYEQSRWSSIENAINFISPFPCFLISSSAWYFWKLGFGLYISFLWWYIRAWNILKEYFKNMIQKSLLYIKAASRILPEFNLKSYNLSYIYNVKVILHLLYIIYCYIQCMRGSAILKPIFAAFMQKCWLFYCQPKT